MADRWLEEKVSTETHDGKPVIVIQYIGHSHWDVYYPDSRLRYPRSSRTVYNYAGAKRFAKRYGLDKPTPPGELLALYRSDGSPLSHYQFEEDGKHE